MANDLNEERVLAALGASKARRQALARLVDAVAVLCSTPRAPEQQQKRPSPKPAPHGTQPTPPGRAPGSPAPGEGSEWSGISSRWRMLAAALPCAPDLKALESALQRCRIVCGGVLGKALSGLRYLDAAADVTRKKKERVKSFEKGVDTLEGAALAARFYVPACLVAADALAALAPAWAGGGGSGGGDAAGGQGAGGALAPARGSCCGGGEAGADGGSWGEGGKELGEEAERYFRAEGELLWRLAGDASYMLAQLEDPEVYSIREWLQGHGRGCMHGGIVWLEALHAWWHCGLVPWGAAADFVMHELFVVCMGRG